MKRVFVLMIAMICLAMQVRGEDKKIATLKLNDVGKVEPESIAFENSSDLVDAVTEAFTTSTNMPFALSQRGDNSWSVEALGMLLPYATEDGSGALDPETGEYHFSVVRYWYDPESEVGESGYPQDRLTATVQDTTFNNKNADAVWSLYISDELFGTVSASIGVYSLDFGGSVVATLNPVENVVYSAEMDKKVDAKISSATNSLSSVAFTGDYNSLKNTPDYEIRASTKNGRPVYKVFLTNPNKGVIQ